jgi:hypothetical protein
MPEAEYVSVQYDEDVLTKAANAGLILPEVEISGILSTRLARQECVIKIDQDYLLSGTQELEIEKPLLVSIDATPKDETIDLIAPEYCGDDISVVKVNSKNAYKDGISVKLNQAFWMGVIVTEAMSEGESDKYKDLKRSRHHNAMLNGLGGLAAGVWCEVGYVYHDDQLYSMLPLLGIMAGVVINAIKLASQNSGDYLKMMEQSKKIKALEMAHKYEVLQIHGLIDGNI